MSLLPADEIGYLDYVGEFFLAQKGSGLVLSPLDVELVRRFEGEGVPFEVLCRGIARAFEARRRHEKPRTPQLSLRACRRSIDAEVRRFRAGAVRGGEPVPPPDRIDRLLGRARAAGEGARLAYRAAYRALCEGEAPAIAAAAAIVRSLSRAERRELLAQARDRAAGGDPGGRRGRLRETLVELALERGRVDLT
ncbi:MAG: hypothetical protein ACYCWW_10315 [Deltaproteobacteria bacterium]